MICAMAEALRDVGTNRVKAERADALAFWPDIADSPMKVVGRVPLSASSDVWRKAPGDLVRAPPRTPCRLTNVDGQRSDERSLLNDR
jgi:hypothetical protein